MKGQVVQGFWGKRIPLCGRNNPDSIRQASETSGSALEEKGVVMGVRTTLNQAVGAAACAESSSRSLLDHLMRKSLAWFAR